MSLALPERATTYLLCPLPDCLQRPTNMPLRRHVNDRIPSFRNKRRLSRPSDKSTISTISTISTSLTQCPLIGGQPALIMAAFGRKAERLQLDRERTGSFARLSIRKHATCAQSLSRLIIVGVNDCFWGRRRPQRYVIFSPPKNIQNLNLRRRKAFGPKWLAIRYYFYT